MDQDIRHIYRAAIERMNVSSDPDIEMLRRTNAKELLKRESPNPGLIA